MPVLSEVTTTPFDWREFEAELRAQLVRGTSEQGAGDPANHISFTPFRAAAFAVLARAR